MGVATGAARVPGPLQPAPLRHPPGSGSRSPERDVAAWAGHSSTAQMPTYDHLRSVAGGDVARHIYDAITT